MQTSWSEIIHIFKKLTSTPDWLDGIRQRYLAPGSFLGNVFVLATGSILGRAITLLVSPVLTRLYSPDDFGVLALFLTLVVLIGSFSTLRYHVAIPMPRHDALAVHLVILSLVILSVVLLITALVLALAGDFLFKFFSLEPVLPYRWLILLAVGSTGIYQVFQFWALRKRNMGTIAATQIWQSISGSAIKIVAGYIGLLSVGLLLGQVVQQAAGIFRLARQFLRDINARTYRLSKIRLICAAKRYSGFPIYRLPSQFLLVMAGQAPLLLISALYGTGSVGQYSLAFTVLAVPISLVGQSIGSAYYAEVSRLGVSKAREIRSLTVTIMKKLVLAAFLPVGLLATLGPEMFELVFGERWYLAGIFAQAMSTFLFVQFVTTPVMHVLTVFQQHARFLQINVVRIVLVACAFALSKWFGFSSIEAITLYSLILALHYGFVAVMVLRLLESSALKNE